MFLSRNKKNNVYPCKPQFYYIKVEFKGVKLYRAAFMMHPQKLDFGLRLALVAQSDARPTIDQEVAGSIPAGSGKIDHETFSTVILSLPLIQEEQLSVSGESLTA